MNLLFWRKKDNKPEPFFRDNAVSGVEVFLDGHTIGGTSWLRGYLNGPSTEGRSLVVTQIDYVRGFVVRVYLASHPGWHCNCQECKKKRDRDGVMTRY